MSKSSSGFSFRLMALLFKVRDLLRPRRDILQELGLKTGFQVLDFGCGPGGYIETTARLVGKAGKVYALDINPSAIKMVRDLAAKKNMENVTTILSDCKTGLPDNSLDVVLLYDVLHGLDDPDCVVAELNRILKPDGVLSLSDHHLKEIDIESKITKQGLFKPVTKGKRTLSFAKAK